jgi:hypothetical protein
VQQPFFVNLATPSCEAIESDAARDARQALFSRVDRLIPDV